MVHRCDERLVLSWFMLLIPLTWPGRSPRVGTSHGQAQKWLRFPSARHSNRSQAIIAAFLRRQAKSTCRACVRWTDGVRWCGSIRPLPAFCCEVPACPFFLVLPGARHGQGLHEQSRKCTRATRLKHACMGLAYGVQERLGIRVTIDRSPLRVGRCSSTSAPRVGSATLSLACDRAAFP